MPLNMGNLGKRANMGVGIGMANIGKANPMGFMAGLMGSMAPVDSRLQHPQQKRPMFPGVPRLKSGPRRKKRSSTGTKKESPPTPMGPTPSLVPPQAPLPFPFAPMPSISSPHSAWMGVRPTGFMPGPMAAMSAMWGAAAMSGLQGLDGGNFPLFRTPIHGEEQELAGRGNTVEVSPHHAYGGSSEIVGSKNTEGGLSKVSKSIRNNQALHEPPGVHFMATGLVDANEGGSPVDDMEADVNANTTHSGLLQQPSGNSQDHHVVDTICGAKLSGRGAEKCHSSSAKAAYTRDEDAIEGCSSRWNEAEGCHPHHAGGTEGEKEGEMAVGNGGIDTSVEHDPCNYVNTEGEMESRESCSTLEREENFQEAPTVTILPERNALYSAGTQDSTFEIESTMSYDEDELSEDESDSESFTLSVNTGKETPSSGGMCNDTGHNGAGGQMHAAVVRSPKLPHPTVGEEDGDIVPNRHEWVQQDEQLCHYPNNVSDFEEDELTDSEGDEVGGNFP
ncbi:unnamed protein product [Choristocarpus tenellus]